ncbi:MAG TPA: hypothetical protein VHO24_17060 [Opitutaceae bacterium]|nr:hypothetical protein [Opitutaceae bacterium]
MKHDAILHGLERWDEMLSTGMNRHGRRLLRLSLALVFIWFGALKTLGSSPANELVARTVYWLRPEVFLPILGWWEVAIGVCLLFRPLLRLGLLLLFLQMPGTFLPFIIVPERCFEHFPFVLTVEGQYIVKNLVLLGAAVVIGGTIHPAPPHRKPTAKV